MSMVNGGNYRKNNSDELLHRQNMRNNEEELIEPEDEDIEPEDELDGEDNGIDSENELDEDVEPSESETQEPVTGYSENNPQPLQTLDDGGSPNQSDLLSQLNEIKNKVNLVLRIFRSPLFWLIVFIAFIVLLIIILLGDNASYKSILCGGSSEFDELKVITTTQHVKKNTTRDYDEPLDSWNFYDYVKSVLYNEFSLDTVPERHAAYQAQAIAIASFAIHRGGYYDRMESNQSKYKSWCGDNNEWVKVDGVDTFKCPNWADNVKIIILPSSTDAQTTCDIKNGCYKYIGESNGCTINLQKSKIDGYNPPATWSRTCGSTTVTATQQYKKPVDSDMLSKYDDLIVEIKGIFLTRKSGTIDYGEYGSAGTTGCSQPAGTSMAMCHDRDNPEAIQSQAESGWSALRILNFWYKDAYLASKSATGVELCQLNTSKITDGLSMLNWTNNNGSNHVADPNFDFSTFTMKQNTVGLSINDFADNIKSAVAGVGIGTRMGVVRAATTYIGTLATFNVKGSYEMGGVYHKLGINPDLGKPNSGTVQGSSANLPISFDCTGFFYWALINGGINSPTNLLGNTLSLKEGYYDLYDGQHKVIGVIGDAMYHKQDPGAYVHVRLIIGHEFDKSGVCLSNITAESAGSNTGIVIKSYSIEGSFTSNAGTPYGIINMQACYEGREGCSIISGNDYFEGYYEGEE